ncbi:hypothetical protein [Streptomyces phytophilus]|uniref:hypothetical protein n=1 Tax=Streptomyces phytophilus TaxID=722715 RepID=UPI0015F003A2|nr:hypothetical protein [Streptomyces phytophilus]
MAIPGNLLSVTTESVDPNTSGWVKKLNCTISLGSGGRNGAGTLIVKSVAAGEMQARTVSSYPIAAGETYHAFADASGATVPERIGIRWLTAANTEISVTWSLTTAAASATWHRISVGGVAPPDAARAQVLLSSTPAAAAVISFFENVYLGLPQHIMGNLLPWNAESPEIDTTSWTGIGSVTIARTVPVVQWPVDYYPTGGHVVSMTATAAGDQAMRTARVPCTEGQEYLAFCYLNPPTSAADTWVEVRFYDAADTQLQATRGELAAPGTGWYRQRASAVAPAGAVTCALAVGIDSASLGQVLRVEQAVIGTDLEFRPDSVVRYSDASFEQGVSGWSVTSGVATAPRSTPWGAVAYEGSYSLIVSSATATTSVIRSPRWSLGGDVSGLSHRIEVYTNVTAGSWNSILRVRWYDAGSSFISSTASSPTAVPTPNWWWLQNDFTPPTGAARAEIELELTATAVSSAVAIDRVALWQVLPFFLVTAQPGTGSVTITLRELEPGELLSLWRVGSDGIRTLVRGPDGLVDRIPITSDLMVFEDYEAPLGVPVSYAAECYDASDNALESFRQSDTVTVDPGDPNLAWLKDPGLPQRNLRLLVERAPDWTRPIEQTGHRIRGRRNTVTISDVRGGLEGELAVWTRDDAERTALHWLLDSGNTLLWQAAPGMGVDDMYVSVGEATEARITTYAPEGWRAWSLPLTQTDMPTAVGVGGSAGRTWQDILSENTTWQDVLDRFATWEDVLFNRPIGG